MKKASRLPDYLGHILEAIHRELPSLYAQIKAVVL